MWGAGGRTAPGPRAVIASTATAILDYLRALAWPVIVAGVLVSLFRRSGSKLGNLIDRLRREAPPLGLQVGLDPAQRSSVTDEEAETLIHQKAPELVSCDRESASGTRRGAWTGGAAGARRDWPPPSQACHQRDSRALRVDLRTYLRQPGRRPPDAPATSPISRGSAMHEEPLTLCSGPEAGPGATCDSGQREPGRARGASRAAQLRSWSTSSESGARPTTESGRRAGRAGTTRNPR
jgi:hypothetical protein